MQLAFWARCVSAAKAEANRIRIHEVPRCQDLYARERLLGRAEALEDLIGLPANVLHSEVSYAIQPIESRLVEDGLSQANEVQAGVSDAGNQYKPRRNLSWHQYSQARQND